MAAVTAPATAFDAPEPFEANPGGAGTGRARPGREAFSEPQADLGFEEEMRFPVGNGLFEKLWVAAPASTEASDELRPLLNARGCRRCHVKDGRGHPPDAGGAVSLLVRLGIPMDDVRAALRADAEEWREAAARGDAGAKPDAGALVPRRGAATDGAEDAALAAEIKACFGAHPDPVYGHQLADRSLPGRAVEARVAVE